MWVSEQLKGRSGETEAPGEIGDSHVVTAGREPAVAGRGPAQVLFPWGVYAVLPQGTAVGCLGKTVLGARSVPPVEVQEGEVCLYTQGGYLLLTREGKVIINGTELKLQTEAGG